MRFYLDSNVFLSLVFGEFGRLEDFMEDATKQFLAKCAADRHTLVLSDLFFDEVCGRSHLTREEVSERIRSFEVAFELIEGSAGDVLAARRLQREWGTHSSDAYHALLAMKANSDFVVTWNLRDFAGSPVPAMSPRQLI